MSTLFLSHAPHDAHLGFAEEVGARVHLLPFRKYTELIKTYPFLGGYVYALISLIYSLFIRVDEDVLLVDGGSSLFTAVFLKKRRPRLTLIYHDADLLFFSLYKRHGKKRGKWNFFIDAIDGVISASEANQKYISMFCNTPMRVSPPYPKDIRLKNEERKPYGLYVGRIDPDKNIERTIAFGLACPHVEKFVVVGGGALERNVRALAKKNTKLNYVGRQNDVETYYNSCTFFVHLPDHDPHPTATMEAVLGGCLPIIGRGAGTQYLFDDMFIVQNPDDHDEINGKMAYLIEHEEEARALLARSIEAMPKKEGARRTFKRAFDGVLEELEKVDNRIG